MTDFAMIDERLKEIQSMLIGPVAGGAITPEATGAIPAPAPVEAYMPAPPVQQYAAGAGAGAWAGEPPIDAPHTPSPAELAERAVTQPAEARARALVATAELEAARIVADARAEVQDLRRQIDELVLLRDRLAQSVAEQQQALAQPPAPPTPTGPAFLEAATRHPVPGQHGTPAQAGMPGYPGQPYAPEPPSYGRGGSGWAPAGSAYEADDAPAPAPRQAQPQQHMPVVPGTFGSEGGIGTLIIGNFDDIDSIERYEDQLIAMDAFDDVYLRAYDSGRAIFELALPYPIGLVSSLQTIAPIAVVNETPAALVATLGYGGNVQ